MHPMVGNVFASTEWPKNNNNDDQMSYSQCTRSRKHMVKLIMIFSVQRLMGSL